jgi:uracil-DNA glycosylase family 4
VAAWEEAQAAAAACARCRLAQGRTTVVFGRGSRSARLLLIGEAPGQEEDRQGLPFVGPAGQLLDRILAAAELPPEDVFITNTVLCRPPGNRQPLPDELAACRSHLAQKFALLRPRMVVLLGAVALKAVLGAKEGITRLRGTRIVRDGIAYYPTFHPAALLRDPSKKRPAWEDFQRIRDDYRVLVATGRGPWEAGPEPEAPRGLFTFEPS